MFRSIQIKFAHHTLNTIRVFTQSDEVRDPSLIPFSKEVTKDSDIFSSNFVLFVTFVVKNLFHVGCDSAALGTSWCKFPFSSAANFGAEAI